MQNWLDGGSQTLSDARSTFGMKDNKMDVPVVVLAGGLGTRLREETEFRPKPMVEIGGHPLLWHIMKIYSSYGFDEFVVCLGYKGDVIKDFFINYRARQGGLSIDLSTGLYEMHNPKGGEHWRVHLLETGIDTMTGGRIKRAAQFLGARRFMATYGDGVADVDMNKLLAFHEAHGRLATISAVRPPSRFGGLTLEGDLIRSFDEKPLLGEGWINGGFMVCEPAVAELIENDKTILERAPLEKLARDGELVGYRHDKFWQCMDTVRDLTYLRDVWNSGSAPWKVW
jgi:glucose-1-phosphate cytidylyltransferase